MDSGLCWKRCLILFQLVIVVIIGSNLVEAISIGPVGQSAPYVPGSSYTFNYQVAGCPCNISLEEGTLSSYASISTTEINSDLLNLVVSLTIPPELPPGKNLLWIKVTQKPPEKKYGQAQVTALAAVRTAIKVKVPYPAKFLDVSQLMEVTEENQPEQPIYFSLPVENLGQESIQLVGGDIILYNGTLFLPEAKIITIPLTEIKNLGGESSGELRAEWTPPADTSAGIYSAVAQVKWDEGELKRDRIFSIGRPQLKINSVEPLTVASGGITKVEVEISSTWNEPITFVPLLSIYEMGVVKDQVKSTQGEINPWGLIKVPFFVDASSLKVGSYPATVELNYLNQDISYNFTLNVTEKNEPKELQSTPGESTERAGGSYVWIMGIAGMIIVLVLAWFYWNRRTKKGGSGGEEESNF
ncbi:hypothetical protein HZC30_05625 [Candidatus Woesearchaeota archaeon]|nr:hypothetical protein [Candidatus Woesearchaeota archaeon]